MADTAHPVLAIISDEHPGLSPLTDGIIALVILLILLILVTRLNRDR